MLETIKNYKNVASFAIPSLLAIVIAEIVNIQVFRSWPGSLSGSEMLFIWSLLQIIPGFIFAWLSDLHLRKATLIICQLLGLVCGCILFVNGYNTWAIIFIAILFNPVPVARAALLDHFPQHSTVMLITITLLAQYAPWIFYHNIVNTPDQPILTIILISLAMNLVLTAFLFKKDSNTFKPTHTLTNIKKLQKNITLLRIGIAFLLAETAFFMTWAYLETGSINNEHLAITMIGTVVGISIALFYVKLPHIAIITLFYSIGTGITALALIESIFLETHYANNFISAMSNYSVIGGLYLPFVTDAVIKLLGAQRRALGSAVIEFLDACAAGIPFILHFLIIQDPKHILITVVCLFTIATILQKSAEHRYALHPHQ